MNERVYAMHDRLQDAADAYLRELADRILAEAKRIEPVQTGDLRAGATSLRVPVGQLRYRDAIETTAHEVEHD